MDTEHTNKNIDKDQLDALFSKYENHSYIKNPDTSVVKQLAVLKENAGYYTKYPITFSNNPSKYPEGRDRDVNQNKMILTCKCERFAPKSEILDKWEDLRHLNLDLIEAKLNSSVAKARDVYNTKLADLISDNGICYDGKSFFSTEHPVNPMKGELGTYTNLINDITLDDEGLPYALDTLRAIKNWDDQPMNLTSDEIILIVSSKKQEAAAKKIDDKIKVIYLPWLEYKAPGTWYVMRNNEAEKPFLVCSDGIEFRSNVLNEYSCLMFNVGIGSMIYGWEAKVGAIYLLPQVIVKCVEPGKIINCANCNKEINKTRPWSKYCSDACKVAFHRKNK